jgi:hypothetical protein
MAQQLPTASPDAAQADSAPQDRHADTPAATEAARSFNGRIVRAGEQFVLKESSTQTLYSLDDQKKAKQYDGKRVQVTATMDSTNTLRVIDIVKHEPHGKPK